MIFKTHLNLVDKFPANVTIQAFIVYPMKKIKEDGEITYTKCKDYEAEIYTLQAILDSQQYEWVGDFKTKPEADKMALILQSIYLAGVNSEDMKRKIEVDDFTNKMIQVKLISDKLVQLVIDFDQPDSHIWYGELYHIFQCGTAYSKTGVALNNSIIATIEQYNIIRSKARFGTLPILLTK